MTQVYAEDIRAYWETGKSSPDTWIEKAKQEIEKAGGTVLFDAYGNEAGERAAYALAFALEGDHFKVVWPVLESRTGKKLSARRQAATMLYHDIKSRCLSARVLGARAAMMGYLVLPDGRTAAEATTAAFLAAVPAMLGGPADTKVILLGSGEDEV